MEPGVECSRQKAQPVQRLRGGKSGRQAGGRMGGGEGVGRGQRAEGGALRL